MTNISAFLFQGLLISAFLFQGLLKFDHAAGINYHWSILVWTQHTSGHVRVWRKTMPGSVLLECHSFYFLWTSISDFQRIGHVLFQFSKFLCSTVYLLSVASQLASAYMEKKVICYQLLRLENNLPTFRLNAPASSGQKWRGVKQVIFRSQKLVIDNLLFHVYLLPVISRTWMLVDWCGILSLINIDGSIPVLQILSGKAFHQTLSCSTRRVWGSRLKVSTADNQSMANTVSAR